MLAQQWLIDSLCLCLLHFRDRWLLGHACRLRSVAALFHVLYLARHLGSRTMRRYIAVSFAYLIDAPYGDTQCGQAEKSEELSMRKGNHGQRLHHHSVEPLLCRNFVAPFHGLCC